LYASRFLNQEDSNSTDAIRKEMDLEQQHLSNFKSNGKRSTFGNPDSLAGSKMDLERDGRAENLKKGEAMEASRRH
jgi:hypothetical protein